MKITERRENEALLHQWIEQEDPHVVALVGIEALTVLADEVGQQEFEAWLQSAIHRASATNSKIANPQPGAEEQQPVAEAPASPGNEGQQ